jgi:PST family polysaccharide transporter
MVGIFAAIGLIQVVAILVGILRAKAIAVMLGPEGVGIISVIDQIIQLASYASALSLPYAAVRFLSRAHSESKERFQRTYAAFLKALLLLSFGATAVLITLVALQPALLGADVARYQMYVLIAALSLPSMMLGGFINNVFASSGQPRSASVFAVLTAIGAALAAVAGIYAGGISGFYWAGLIAGTTVTAAALLYLKSRLGLSVAAPHAGIRQELRRNPGILSFSLMFFVTSVAFSFSFLVARYAVLHHFGEAEAGLLHALLAIGFAVSMVLNPINGLLLTPKMNRAIAHDEKRHTALEFQKILMLVLAGAAVPLVLFPQFFLTLLFSAKFTGVSGDLYLFVLAQCLLQLGGVYSSLLIGLDDIKMFTVVSLGGHLTFAAMAWLAAPSLGIYGIGLAFCASAVLLVVLSLWPLHTRHQFRISGRVAGLTGFAVAAILGAGLLANALGPDRPLVIVVKMAAYAAALGGLLGLLGKSGRDELRAWARQALRRGRPAPPTP